MFHEHLHLIGAIAVIVFIVGWHFRRLGRASRLAKLGGKPKQLPYYLPFGLDTLWETVMVKCHLIG